MRIHLDQEQSKTVAGKFGVQLDAVSAGNIAAAEGKSPIIFKTLACGEEDCFTTLAMDEEC